MEDVSESEIISVQKLLKEFDNISVGYEASAALAGCVKLMHDSQILKSENIVINLTGDT